MHPRLYRLTELHQRIDEALRRPRGHPLEIARLLLRKLRVKQLMNRIVLKTAHI
jgi:hypothetical protein